MLKRFLYFILIIFVTVLHNGCGNNKSEDSIKSIGISVPLASEVDCASATGAFSVLPNGRCAVFNGYTSLPINLPFPINEAQSIRLELIDPAQGRHVIAQLNQNINSVQNGGFVYLTDVQNPNQPVCRLTLQGTSQAFAEIDLTGSTTMSQLYQSLFQSQTTAQMQLVFVRKQD